MCCVTLGWILLNKIFTCITSVFQIHFQCGLKDEVHSIQETEVCEYTIKMSTPAAC